ncbi:MAG: S41 family peptidase [Anaerolineae bacterium]
MSAPSTVAAGLSKATRHAVFMQTWMLINDLYVHPDYGGLDWEAVKEEYSEKVANAASDEEFYDVMREMVDLLWDEHSSFLVSEVVALQHAIYENLHVPGGIGAILADSEGELVLLQVLPDNPAFEAGLRPGEQIVAVDSVPLEQFRSFDEVVLAIIGEAGTEVVLTVQSVDGIERHVPIKRASVDLGNTLVQATMIDRTNIALLTIGGLDSPHVAEDVRETLGELIESGMREGLIVDVRANPGGDVEALLDTLALFIPGGSMGTQAGRKETHNLLIPEGETMPELEGLPIVVLIGPQTSNAGEWFAAGMQLYGRATIVGMPSAGNTESVVWHELSDGSVVAIAERVYRLPDGTLLEGRGVQPDVLVPMDWWLYGAENDPQMHTAIEMLSSE